MRIHHIINDVKLENGGAERLVRVLHEGLRRRDVDSRIVSLTDTTDYGLAGMTPMGLSSPYNANAVLRLRKYIRECCDESDIIHAHLFPAMFFTTIARRLSGWKGSMVFTEHSTSNRRRGSLRGRIIDSMGYSGYHVVACISEGTRASLVEWRPELRDSVRVVENGASLVFDAYREPQQKNALTVLSVGRLEKPKNYDAALRAVAEITDIEFKYRIAGDGFLMAELKDLANELGIANRVEFLGYVEDVSRLMLEADVFFIPSLWEGFGLAAVEAMNASLPVVAGDVDGLRDVVGCDGRCGPLVDPLRHESIVTGLKRALSDAELRRSCAQRAFVKSLDYSADRMVDEYIQLYAELSKGADA